MPEICSVSFDDLDPRTAYALWRLRAEVFVVEQQCFYQDLDGRDLEPGTRHVWVAVDDEPVAYLRVLDEGDHVRIGRVLVAVPHRGRGLADALMRSALELAGSRTSVLAAQSAVNTTTSQRQNRIRDLKAELARIDALADRARGLVKSLARTS